jgi:DNA-binding winged helix-turn-helix (wHTH) protein
MLYVFGECTLDTQRYELCRAGRVNRLRHIVFQVLVYLLAHADRFVSKAEVYGAMTDSRSHRDDV